MQTTYHNKRDSKGRFAPKVSQLVASPVHTKRIVNHIAIIMDGSGSMAHIWDSAMAALKAQIDTMRRASLDTNQHTFLHVIDFAPITVRAKGNILSKEFDCFNLANRDSDTPLNDSIAFAINALNYERANPNDDNSYAVIIITDGHENRSKLNSLASIKNQIMHYQKLGTWTFAINCPPGSKDKINRDYGIPLGNINEWERTSYGTQIMSAQTSHGTQSYFATRGVGGQSLSNFFVDATKFTDSDVTKLQVARPKHNKVEKEVGISDFFAGKNIPYYAGMAFYELTKKELVQDHKRLIILDLDSGNYYMDSTKLTVRKFLKIPTGDVKLDPKNVGKYRIYVQSTSDNRKLVRGTTVLYGV